MSARKKGDLPLQVEILFEHLKASGPKGQSLMECAQATGRDSFDTAIDLQDLRVRYNLIQTLPESFNMTRWRAK